MSSEAELRLKTIPNQKNKIIPTQEQLDEISRDLCFYPSQCQNPITLAQPQVKAFNELGYIKGIPVFDRDEIFEYRRHFDVLLEEVIAVGGGSYSILSAHLKYGKIYDLLKNPRIVCYIRDLVGEDIIGWGAHYFCKLPGDNKIVAWHQDASYWPLTPSKTVTVWLAIDDSDVENGCMRFMAGSHQFGHLMYKKSDPSENNILNQTVDNAEQHGKPVDVELQAGSISIHSDLLLHSSNTNNSNRRRCGLTLRYCTPDVRGHLHWNEEGIVVSGKDRSGHWANPVRTQNN